MNTDKPWTRGLLIRRNPTDGDMAYFATCCPKGTSIETLVRVKGTRWRIEEGFETAKNELGLDHNETRSWHGWHRHVSLVMLAYAMIGCRPNIKPTARRKKRNLEYQRTHPLVGPENSAPRLQTRPASDKACPHSCMVRLPTRPSSGSAVAHISNPKCNCSARPSFCLSRRAKAM